MSQLTFYLPPFSSDYAGACSGLFELNCMIVLCDAACCTKNYVSMDEPRLYGRWRPIFSASLNEIDAVLGNDDRLISKIKRRLESVEKPDLIALIGSPVPSIIASDLQGIAEELETETGIPSFGFSSTGLRYYSKGLEDVTIALIKRYTRDPLKTDKNSVNILGLSPIDYSDNGNAENIKILLNQSGFNVKCSFMMGATLNQISLASEAEVNLVVSKSGIRAAEYMQNRWGIPFAMYTPVGEDVSLSSILQYTITAKEGFVHQEVPTNDGGLLIVGDQVIANSLRDRLAFFMGWGNITVGTFFGLENEIAKPFDLNITSEKHLIEILDSGKYFALMGDPLLQTIPNAQGMTFFPIPHLAVSSYLYLYDYCTFVGSEMETKLWEYANILKFMT